MTINKHRIADWTKAPAWAMFHAIDGDWEGNWIGELAVFEPYKIWAQQTESSGFYDLNNIDWKETLESRPE